MKHTNKLWYTLLLGASAAALVCGLAACDIGGGSTHEHPLTEHAAQSATCEADGNAAYWECTECHKYFKDSKGSEEYAENGWVIAATGHAYHEHGAVNPSCTVVGNSKYYTCDNCTKVFDEDKEECEQDAWVIAKLEHNYTTYEPNSATCTEDGNYLYFYCETCGQYFDAEKEVCEENDWVIKAAGHAYHWYVETEPTAEAEGSAQCECTKCGADHLYSATLPALTQANVADEKYTYEKNETANCEDPVGETFTTTETLTPHGTLSFAINEGLALGHQWVSDAPEGNAEGGTITATCENCHEQRTFTYTDLLPELDSATYHIQHSGLYYHKWTTEVETRTYVVSIPILAAGLYRVEFFDLDHHTGTDRRSFGYSSIEWGKAANTGAGGVLALKTTGWVVTGRWGSNAQYERIQPSYASQGTVRYYEIEITEEMIQTMKDEAVGESNMSIRLRLKHVACADDPIPFLIDIQTPNVIVEGKNTVEITEANSAVDAYAFNQAQAENYTFTFDENELAALGSLTVTLDGTVNDEGAVEGGKLVFDSEWGDTTCNFYVSSGEHTLIFSAEKKGTVTVTVVKDPDPDAGKLRPDKKLEFSLQYNESYEAVVADSVEEGWYKIYPTTGNLFGRNNLWAVLSDRPDIKIQLYAGRAGLEKANLQDDFSLILYLKPGDSITYTNPNVELATMPITLFMEKHEHSEDTAEEWHIVRPSIYQGYATRICSDGIEERISLPLLSDERYTTESVEGGTKYSITLGGETFEFTVAA